MDGDFSMAFFRLACLTPASRVSETAVAEVERGPGSNRAISPKISPGPMMATRFSRPSEAVRPSLIFPEITK